jgi:DNA repair exonuclease SbcCD ATPase subunit
MSSENYINHYVEILTSTMTDAVIRNISLQANAKISESVIGEQQNKIEKLNSEVEKILNVSETEKNNQVANLNGKIEEQKNYIINLENQLGELNNMKGVYENVKHQVDHIDTFKNELIKERDLHQQTRNDYELKIQQLNGNYELKIQQLNGNYELTIKELNEKIEYLQLTPAKRKKIDEIKVPAVVETLEVNEIDNSIIKDGGSF